MTEQVQTDTPGKAAAKDVAKGKASGSVEAVVEAVYDAFRNGRIVPGQRLAEPDLMARFGVGRGTVREALKRLAGDGLVTITRYQGAVIRSLSKAEIKDAYQLLEMLYGLAARQAAQRLTEADAAPFTETFNHLLSLAESGDFYAAVNAREAFFDQICQISRNAELLRMQPRVLLLIIRLQIRSAMQDEVRFRDYKMIGEAILNRDSDMAEFAARRHLQHAMEDFDKIPSSELADDPA